MSDIRQGLAYFGGLLCAFALGGIVRRWTLGEPSSKFDIGHAHDAAREIDARFECSVDGGASIGEVKPWPTEAEIVAIMRKHL